MRRLLAIGLIWLGCSLAWLVLGSTLLVRSDETFFWLGDGVFALWGPPMRQLPPRAVALEPRDPAAAPATAAAARDVPLAGSDIEVTLDLEHRKVGPGVRDRARVRGAHVHGA